MKILLTFLDFLRFVLVSCIPRPTPRVDSKHRLLYASLTSKSTIALAIGFWMLVWSTLSTEHSSSPCDALKNEALRSVAILWLLVVMVALVAFQMVTCSHLHIPAWAKMNVYLHFILTDVAICLSYAGSWLYFGQEILKVCAKWTELLPLLWVCFCLLTIIFLMDAALLLPLASLHPQDWLPSSNDSDSDSSSVETRSYRPRRFQV